MLSWILQSCLVQVLQTRVKKMMVGNVKMQSWQLQKITLMTVLQFTQKSTTSNFIETPVSTSITALQVFQFLPMEGWVGGRGGGVLGLWQQ